MFTERLFLCCIDQNEKLQRRTKHNVPVDDKLFDKPKADPKK